MPTLAIKAGDWVAHIYDGDAFIVGCVSPDNVWLVDVMNMSIAVRVDHVELLTSSNDRAFSFALTQVMQQCLASGTIKPPIDVLHWAIDNYIRNKPHRKVSLLNQWYELNELGKAIYSERRKLAQRILTEI